MVFGSTDKLDLHEAQGRAERCQKGRLQLVITSMMHGEATVNRKEHRVMMVVGQLWVASGVPPIAQPGATRHRLARAPWLVVVRRVLEKWRPSGVRAPRGISRCALWSRATTAMDAPVPLEPMPVPEAAPEREPVIGMEDPLASEVPENTNTEAEAPASAPVPGGTRKVSRPVQPPQKGTTLFPLARVSKIIKVCGL